MNVERILELADIIEKQPHTKVSSREGFNMGSFEHDCGTPCCIGGWANALFGNGRQDCSDDASGYLGLESEVGDELYFPCDTDVPLDAITPAHAAAVLRHLAETGRVDWSVSAPVEERA